MGHILFTQEQPGFRLDLLRKTLVNIGVKHGDALAIARVIQKWIAASGFEWTVNHLKKVKALYLNWFAESGETPDWIAYSRKLPLGPFRALSSYSRAVIVKAVNIHKVFSLHKDVVLPAQKSKFLRAVLSPLPSDSGMQEAKSLIRVGSSQWTGLNLEKGIIPTLAGLPDANSEERRLGDRQFAQAVEILRTTNLAIRIPPLAEAVAPLSVYRVFTSYNNLPSSYDPPCCVMTPSEAEHATGVVIKEGGKLPEVMGSINASQEPGLKARFFASPHVLYQAGLEPLKRGLFGLLALIEQDCTFNQSKGLIAARQWLSEGRMVHSIDLSSATDTFPRDLQLSWFSESSLSAGTRDLLNLVVNGEYSPNPSLVRAGLPSRLAWTVGQPLGAGPSFALFALAHHALVRGIFLRLCRPFRYCILGDDIIISDDDVAREYVRVMNSLGCQVASDKTISSNRIAEFASVVVDKRGFYGSTKHQAVTDDSFTTYLAAYGPSLTEGYVGDSPMRKGVVEALADLPECLGGLGFNPSRLSLDARLAKPTVAALFAHLINEEVDELRMCTYQVSYDRITRLGYSRLDCLPSQALTVTASGPFHETPSQAIARLEIVNPVEEIVPLTLDGVRQANPWSRFDETGRYITRRSGQRRLQGSATRTVVRQEGSLLQRIAGWIGLGPRVSG